MQQLSSAHDGRRNEIGHQQPPLFYSPRKCRTGMWPDCFCFAETTDAAQKSSEAFRATTG